MTAPENKMTAIEIARRFAEMGQVEDAVNAYSVALQQGTTTADERLEAACAVFQFGGDYTIAYDAFLALYREGHYTQDIRAILDEAFYLPNVKQQEKRYKKNCKLLKTYPYLFRKDFLPFEELPVRFYPYDDNGVLPFFEDEERFDTYINVNDPQITHYFFRDLEKPVFAQNIFSQYELEYLKDNVRRSDWVARENHIYLHYPDWGVFCSYLQLLDMKMLLEDEKFVFLIGEEKSLYPIDFKERFGIDYSQYSVKPIGIREVNKIIWHTQLHSHNGGDFFNEILHEHPNIFAGDSLIFSEHLEAVTGILETAKKIARNKEELCWSEEAIRSLGERTLRELTELKKPTLKDAFVVFFLENPAYRGCVSDTDRIVPAFYFQPHFYHLNFEWNLHESQALAFTCKEYEIIKDLEMMQQFKYIKTFTPLRRPTTSHGATMRFLNAQLDGHFSCAHEKLGGMALIRDEFYKRVINRSFMVSPEDRLYADSRLVRFEDAKLNPRATFTALAEFLDIPYTQSMTYCSNKDGRDPYGVGFSTAPVYRAYDEFCDPYERELIEYLLRDVYQKYGYDYQHYDGAPMSLEEQIALLKKCHTNFDYIEKSWRMDRDEIKEKYQVDGEALDLLIENSLREDLESFGERRELLLRVLGYSLPFCNAQGERLELMKQLELDSNLLEQPLYH